MSKYQIFLQNFTKFIIAFTLGALVVYIGLNIWAKYQVLQDASKIIKLILSYKLHESTNLSIGKIIFLLFLLVIGVFVAKFLSYKLMEKVLKKTNLNKGAKAAFENLSYYVLVFLAILMALNIAEVPLTIFTFFGGALAIGLGFGSQNILSNFISGIILQVEQPVKVGDIIEIEGTIGTIEHIGGRSTKIISSNNTHMILPNSYLLDKKLVNWTFQDNIFRSKVEIGLDYSTDIDLAEKVILETLQEIEVIKENPAPRVILNDFGAYSLNFVIYFWIPLQGTLDKNIIESNFKKALFKNLKKKNIQIPFPHQTINIQNERIK